MTERKKRRRLAKQEKHQQSEKQEKRQLDILLRELFQQASLKLTQFLTGKKGIKLLDNTFPSVKERQADVVIELEDSSILHIEIQSYPDKKMPFRMLEYYSLLKSRYSDREIRQMVLYVGEKSPRMENAIKTDRISFEYDIVDIKEIKCKELMESSKMEDKIFAALCNVEDPENYFNQLIDELLKLPKKEREDYFKKLLVALNYRPDLNIVLKNVLEERKMPLTITKEMLEKNPFFQEGVQKGELKAKREAIINLRKELNLSPERIAKVLKVSEDFVREVLEEENL